ncbi:NACHT, LRR and PYD domains-containing protein 12-like [Engraulis encrasicolus]|uniref:NACHT, LRR and PYD domains-containing protein 12-like n=1 Tax=Engraulis encrasicolus TaxID=184585 RepID=UPI002FD3E151
MNKRPDSPTLSFSWMKSDQSKDDLITFRSTQGDTHPNTRPIQNKRPDSPTPSFGSMKSDQSKDGLITFRSTQGDTRPIPSKRPASPTLSCVSMKSDQSKDDLLTFRDGGNIDLKPRPIMNKRPDSPTPSCVSMKSDQSKDGLITFRSTQGDTHPNTRPIQNKRTDSSTPSCVSMKSDQSKDDLLTFNERQGDNSPNERPDSPTPSFSSMKSDQSKEDLVTFRDIDLQVKPSTLLLDQTTHSSTRKTATDDLSAVFEKFEHRAITFMKNELKRLKKLLSPDYPESPGGEDEEEEKESEKDQIDARDGALRIAVHFLKDMSQEVLAQQLEEYGLFSRCQQELKNRLSKRFQSVFEGIPTQGNPASLEKIYTELYITKRECVEVSTEHEVRQIERASKTQVTKGERAISYDDVFKPLPGQDKPIRTVLTKGVAGVGKTVSVQKFILDWTERRANQSIHFLLPMPFREINLIEEKKYNLMEFIHHFFKETGDFIFSSDQRYNIAFIFDGLEESRLPLDFQHNEGIYSVSKPASVDVLLTNLIKGNLLPSALVWITSRPAATNQIPSECIDQLTEVRGFTDSQKEEYFKKRIREDNTANRIIAHLKSSRSLYIMCNIPIFCWIAATVLKSILVEAKNDEIPSSFTQMYIHFLIIQAKHISQKYKDIWNRETILSLGRLAFQQLEKGNLIFYENDLSECGIDAKDATVYTGVCTQICREEAGIYQGKVYSFVHLSIQEFLAALYVFLHFIRRETRLSKEPVQHQTSPLKALLNANTLHELHQTAVDLALKNKNGHLDLFLRFLLGLSLGSNQKLLQDLLPQTGSSSLKTRETVQYIKAKIGKAPNPDRCINLFHCLNELNDHFLVDEVQGYLRHGIKPRVEFSLSQLSALAFVLLMSEQEVEEFNLGDYGKNGRSHAGLLRMMPVVKSSRTVKLSNCFLTRKSCSALSSVFRSRPSSLIQLNLTYNSLGDLGAEMLSSGLEHPNCRLETLEMQECNLDEGSCSYLASALRLNPSSLKQLDLTYNGVGDSGVGLLSSGLQHPNCRLDTLTLKDCSLTWRSCSSLAAIFRSSASSLRQLNLTDNNLEDPGVQLLSAGLVHPNCRLETLKLQWCKLTERSCASLASALKSNPCCLRELDLRHNKLHQSGVELLTALQKDPAYKLTTLLC